MGNNLEKDLVSEIRKTKRIYPPYYWNKWGCDPQEFTNALCNLWNSFPNPHIRNNLVDLTGKNEQFYYEVCDTPYKRGVYVHRDRLFDWCIANQKINQHHSVFFHNSTWIDQIHTTDDGQKRVGGIQNSIVGTDFLQLELDRHEGLNKAIQDGIKIKLQFPIEDAVSLLYSGNNSIHVVVDMGVFGNPLGNQSTMTGRGKIFWNLAHKIAGDVRHENGIIDPYAKVKKNKTELVRSYIKLFNLLPNQDDWLQELENIDPNLFYVNSLVRSPYSWHEKGKRQKSLLNISDLLSGVLQSNNRLKKLNTKPTLLHWYYDCLQETHKIERKKFASNASSSYIENVFNETLEDFYPEDASADGWVNKLYSPFYEDTNPSVGVNILTGQYKDFGLVTHTFTFEEYLSKVKNISINKTKQLIKDNGTN